LELQVIDGSTPAIVLFSKPVPSATIDAGGDSLTQSATVIGQEILLSGSGFESCVAGAKLRFAWNIPEAFTGPAQFVLDNVSVTPLLAVRKLESETETTETTAARISLI
jgi:hypothetical protein